MNINDCKTIKLESKASEEFARRLFHPTAEETRRSKEVMDRIERDVTIIDTDDGFMAVCKDLDLSFLHE